MDRLTWLKDRQKGIGSSDVAAVLGISPYMNAMELYESKIGEVKAETGNFITDQGNRFEPMIRELVELERFETYAPALVEDEDYPMLRASLDGQSPDGQTIIEIKIMGKEPWEAARDRKEIPPHYRAQMVHQLGVTGAKRCIFAAHLYEKGMTTVSREKLVMIEVPYDEVEIMAQMLKVLAFWNDHVVARVPPAVAEEYRPLEKTDAITQAFNEWKTLTAQADEIADKIQKARDVLLTAAQKSGHKKLIVDDLRIRQETRKGNIEYKKIPAIQAMTEAQLEPFRGKAITSWKLETIKEKK